MCPYASLPTSFLLLAAFLWDLSSRHPCQTLSMPRVDPGMRALCRRFYTDTRGMDIFRVEKPPEPKCIQDLGPFCYVVDLAKVLCYRWGWTASRLGAVCTPERGPGSRVDLMCRQHQSVRITLVSATNVYYSVDYIGW